MVADFFTKPLQGRLFRTLRDQIKGIVNFESLKERVGDNRISDVRNEQKAYNDVTNERNKVGNDPDIKRPRTYADVTKGKLSQ